MDGKELISLIPVITWSKKVHSSRYLLGTLKSVTSTCLIICWSTARRPHNCCEYVQMPLSGYNKFVTVLYAHSAARVIFICVCLSPCWLSVCVYRSSSKTKGKGLLFRGRVPVSNLDIEDIEDGTCESLCMCGCMAVFVWVCVYVIVSPLCIVPYWE